MSIKLLNKFIGHKVVLADGTRTTIKAKLATAYKLETGKSIKPELLELKGTTLKEIKASVTKKAAPVARGAKAAPAKKAPATTSRGAKAAPAKGTTDWANAPRRECVTELLLREVFTKRADAQGIYIEDLREMAANPKKAKPVAKKAPAPTARGAKAASAKKAAPVKRTTRAVRVVEEDDDDVPGVRSTKKKPTLAQVRARSATIKAKAVEKTNLRDIDAFNDKIATRIDKLLNTDELAVFIRTQTGYNIDVAAFAALQLGRRCTLQIGLVPMDADQDERDSYLDALNEANEEAAELEDELASEIEDLDDEEEEEEEEDDGLGDLDEEESEEDDDLGELDGDDEEEEEEEESEEVAGNVDELLAVAKGVTKLPAKLLQPLVEQWLANPEITETFGDEVEIGTKLISRKTGNTLVTVGYSADKEQVALFDETAEKLTFASIATVVKMEFAEDLEEAEEEEEDEDLDDEESEEDDLEEDDLDEEEDL